MINPSTITNYNLNKYQLQEMAIFWVLVAGKTAKTTARMLDNMLVDLHREYDISNFRPFDVIRMYDEDNPDNGLENLMKKYGFGCQKAKAKGIRELIRRNLNLKICAVEELEGIYGIGPKTARCFILHTRSEARYAGLDIHILKWLKSLGYTVPKSTPRGKIYSQLENVFLKLADALNTNSAELDLAIWNAYSSGGEYKIDLSNLTLPKQ